MIEGLKGKVTVVLTTHYLEEAESFPTESALWPGADFLRLELQRS